MAIPHLRRVTVNVSDERLRTRIVHLDRSSGPEGEQAGVDVHAEVFFAPESAADTGKVEPNRLKRKPQRRSDLGMVAMKGLGGYEEIDTVVRRNGERGLCPEERLILHPNRVPTLDSHIPRRVGISTSQPNVSDHISVGMDETGSWGRL